MKHVYIKPLAELVPVHAKTAFLEMSGEVDWGMGNKQTIFEEDDNSLPKSGNLWGEDGNSNENK